MKAPVPAWKTHFRPFAACFPLPTFCHPFMLAAEEMLRLRGVNVFARRSAMLDEDNRRTLRPKTGGQIIQPLKQAISAMTWADKESSLHVYHQQSLLSHIDYPSI